MCENSGQCVGNLQCSARKRGDRFGRCHDESKSLHLGAKCDPNATLHEARCVQTGSKKTFFTDTQCLTKGKSFACQLPKTLFQKCVAESNEACVDDGLIFGSLGACMFQK